MIKRISITVIMFVVLLNFRSIAQSYHFSQFYSSPLLNNPALTGYNEGNYRIAANFRSQWAQGSSPYLTTAVSFDTRGLRNYIEDKNKFGAGVYLMNDQSSGGALQANSIGISTAYNISLDESGVQLIGVGLQGVFNQRRIDYSKLSFESQYGANGFDPSLPVGEQLNLSSKAFFNMNAGFIYHYNHDYNSFFGGASVYNAFNPQENMPADEFRTLRRYSVMAGGHIAIGYDRTVYASFNYMNQAKANEFTVGAAYGIQIGEDKRQELNFGLWHRVKDAIIPYIGYQLNGFQFGLSYDYTISSIKAASQVRNGYELSLSFTGVDQSEQKRLLPWY